jgi:type ISP restriction-modification system protein
VVHAQVRLVEDLLRNRFGCAEGFGDPRVGIIDPATGSGAYPLAILATVADGCAEDVKRRMWLFESQPGAALLARARGLPVRECDVLATRLVLERPIAVCLGNPPYGRRAATAAERSSVEDMAEPAQGIHRKNLYNAYIYFWQWALRTLCEGGTGGAVVCFVTAASYLRGPAFGGVRRRLRALLDDLWVIDLEGDHLAARASHNVFLIRTPVAIALGVRYAAPAPSIAASAAYTRLGGTGAHKLSRLGRLRELSGLTWTSAPSGWTDPLVAASRSAYQQWPALTDLFPWQLSGAQLKRTWPIGVTPEVLRQRWRHLLELPPAERQQAFGPTRDRDISSQPLDLLDTSHRLAALRDLPAEAPCPEPVRYAYRAFDRHWLIPDARCGDFMRPSLRQIHGPRQVFMTSMLTNVLGPGPAAVVTALVPDLDHFRGSFGARGVIPMWRDAAASRPNVSSVWLARLSEAYGFEVTPEALLAYCYAMLAAPSYTSRFAEELRTPGPRVPLTLDGSLFRQVAVLGDGLVRLHTFREVPRGQANVVEPIGARFPSRYTYDPQSEVLHVGAGAIGIVPADAWAFSVSGYRVLGGWLRRRVAPRAARSPLDAIRPAAWTAELTDELLQLLWLIEATLARQPALDAALDQAASGRLLGVDDVQVDVQQPRPGRV